MNVDLNGVALDIVLPSVQLVAQLFTRQHHPQPLQKYFQQGELLG